MVGVPGRSKGCGTCRRRKKGNCDRKRPYCSQCLLKGLKCDGYGRETIFLHATAGKTKQYRVDRPSEKAISPHGAITGTLARAAYEEHYLGSFLHVYLPQGREFPSCAIPYMSGGWTVALPKLCGISPVIREIMLAVCLAMQGQATGSEREREEGMKYYTASLQRMAGALKDRDKVDHSTLVVATRIFSMYEVLCGHDVRDLPAQAENWRKHIIGEHALLMSRPPESYASGYMHQMWVDGRLHLATCFLQSRKRSRLSCPEWMTIPWQTIPKTPKDLIVDILMETTGLLEDIDTLKAQDDPESRDVLRRELVQKCWELETELAAWLGTVRLSDPTYALNVSDAGFSMDLLAAAHIMCVYWCACIVTYSTLRDLLSPAEAAMLPPHMDPRLYFRRIAEAATVLLHPSSGMYGAQLTYFPTAVVGIYLRRVGGGDEAKKMIFDAYRRAGKEKISERFLASLREQEAMNGW